MVAPIRVLILPLFVLAGCSSVFQVGLANAPGLSGDTRETRVHDVIANAHDACERSSFPAGEVLRGQTLPCATEKNVSASVELVPGPTPRRGVRSWHGLGVCASAGTGFTRSEVSLTGVSLMEAEELVCEPW